MLEELNKTLDMALADLAIAAGVDRTEVGEDLLEYATAIDDSKIMKKAQQLL